MRAIVGAAHGLEVEVVAEGVEDVATVRRLRELGCDRLQGYAVAAPADLAALRAWAARGRRSATGCSTPRRGPARPGQDPSAGWPWHGPK